MNEELRSSDYVIEFLRNNIDKAFLRIKKVILYNSRKEYKKKL